MSTRNPAPRPRGRLFFFNPGPTNIPDPVLQAMARPTVDFFAADFLALQTRVIDGIKRVLKTRQHLLMYCANGHGAWEAALVNVLAPGDRVLVLESGRFSTNWGEMAQALGYGIETLTCDWRKGVAPDAVADRLKKDGKGEIKAVLVVHNETSTGMTNPVADIRKAIDAARHPALLFVDTISSLGSIDFRMDEWGVDLAVGGSQKGLMMATGVSFTGVSEKAMALSRKGGAKRSYWDWAEMLSMSPQRFPGTTPVHMFYGLEASLKLIEEEGLDAVLARHTRLARATRAAVSHWGGGSSAELTIDGRGMKGKVGALELLCADRARDSDSVSAILVPDGVSADRLRAVALERFNLSLGGGLAVLADRVFRIGHMGDLNEPMLLGALATVELAFRTAGVPYRAGGVEAAIAVLAVDAERGGRKGAA